MTSKFGHKEWFVFVSSILVLTDLSILLNIPYIRQTLGFLFLTLLLGLLILQILKLNKLNTIETILYSVGLSIAFVMFFGLLVNNLSLNLGYETPLSAIPLLISFKLAIIALAIITHRINKGAVFTLPDLNLSTSEKAFLIVPVLFPTLSILGTHYMNTTGTSCFFMLQYVFLFTAMNARMCIAVIIFALAMMALVSKNKIHNNGGSEIWR